MCVSKICVTCGTHYALSSDLNICPICNDDRQYIPESGQAWTTPEQLTNISGVRILPLRDSVYELMIKPDFAISQRALFIVSEHGNVLWDCIPLLNQPTIDFITARGGLRAIAFSHPHYYSNMHDWADTFDCTIHIHERDKQWIIDRQDRVSLWQGDEKVLWDGMRLLHIGGHFPGSAILHVPFLSEAGVVFSGDTLVLSPSKKHISVMYSYPNRIPLPLREVARINERLKSIQFDALYTYHSDQNLTTDVKGVLENSMKRYLE